MTVKVDARRLLCPMPVIRIQDAIKQVAVGDCVEITCTDPGVLNDIPAWSRINGHSVVNIIQGEYEIVITVQKQNEF